MSNSNENIFLEDNQCYEQFCEVSASSPLWLLRRWVFNMFFANLAFRLPWQPIKLKTLHKNDTLDRGLPKEHFCKTKYLQWGSSKGLVSLFPLQVNGNFKLPWQRNHMSNDKNIIFGSSKCYKHFCKASTLSPLRLLRNFFPANLAFRLPWQAIKFSGLDRTRTFGRGLRKKHSCKTVVKISAVR